MRAPARRGFTLVEVAVASVVLALVFYGAFNSVKTFTGAVKGGDVSLDRLQELAHGAELLARDVREARQIIHPAPGAPPSKLLYLRNFDGRIVVFWYSDAARELRRGVLGLDGTTMRDQRPPARTLDDAYFSVTNTGLVSWGLFIADTGVLGSAGRKNQ